MNPAFHSSFSPTPAKVAGSSGPAPTPPAFDLLAQHGTLPLPPYIRKGRAEPDDRERYQTIYAAEPGSVAAPTAGLHFTPEVFTALENRQIQAIDLTLHVGIGTFRPIEVDNDRKTYLAPRTGPT